MAKKTPNNVIRFRANPAMKARIEKLARKKMTSPSHILRDAIWEMLNREEAQQH